MSREQLILGLGILSIVFCGFLGPIAIYQANTALQMIDHEGYDASERGLVLAGQICGIVGTGMWALGLLVYLARRSQGAM